MDVTRAYHISEVSQKQKLPYHITYMWNLKYDTHELIYETETDSHREQTVVEKGEAAGGVVEWEVGGSKWKLLYMEYMDNKVLLYNTENYI